jgi:hypothetical protein
MKHGELLGLDLCALCVASVGKKQFKMTALDIAGDDLFFFCFDLCLHFILFALHVQLLHFFQIFVHL